jgi:hypothetical protein
MIKEVTEPITEDAIEIFGVEIEEDGRAAGYAIGDMLNMPALGGYWPFHNPELVQRLYLVAPYYPNSIAQYYIENRPHNEPVPYLPRVQGAVRRYIESNPSLERDAMIAKVDRDDVLCVHVRTGDRDTEPEFLRYVIECTQRYKQVYLFSGLHLDQYVKTNDIKKQNFLKAINPLLHIPNVTLVMADPDVHIALMSNARHFLAHKGGFSAIGAIVCKGTVYISQLMETVNNHWAKHVDVPHVKVLCK